MHEKESSFKGVALRTAIAAVIGLTGCATSEERPGHNHGVIIERDYDAPYMHIEKVPTVRPADYDLILKDCHGQGKDKECITHTVDVKRDLFEKVKVGDYIAFSDDKQTHEIIPKS